MKKSLAAVLSAALVLTVLFGFTACSSGLVGVWEEQEHGGQVELRSDGSALELGRYYGKYVIEGDRLTIIPESGGQEKAEEYTYVLQGDSLRLTDAEGTTHFFKRVK